MDDSMYLGYRWNPETGQTGDAETFDLASHLTLIGPTGVSKGVSFEIPNLLLGLHRSIVVNIDPSGQNAAVTAAARAAKGSKILPLNPMAVHVKQYRDLQSVGCNPLLALDPTKPAEFFMRAAAIAEATVPVEGENNRFFGESARDLWTWLVMFVRLRDGDNANLGTCRDLLTEAELTEDTGDE